jgi:hypothetical protein
MASASSAVSWNIKVGRKTSLVSFDLFIKPLGRGSVEFRQVGVENGSLPPNQENSWFNPLDENQRLALG